MFHVKPKPICVLSNLDRRMTPFDSITRPSVRRLPHRFKRSRRRMSPSTSCFALPVRSSWVRDRTVSHRAVGSPPPAADPRCEQSSIRALSTWNWRLFATTVSLPGSPFISGTIRTLCAPSVSRETAGSGYHPSSFDIRYPGTVPASQRCLQIGGPSKGAAAGWRSTSHTDLTASMMPVARGPPASSERRNYGTLIVIQHLLLPTFGFT